MEAQGLNLILCLISLGTALRSARCVPASAVAAVGIQHSMPSSAPAGLQHDAGRRHCVSVASDTTALDSLQHSTCTLIHMGSYLLSECRNRPYTAQDAALPPIAGEPVVQILPQALVERAGLFPPMDAARQVGLPQASCLPVHCLCLL